MMQPILLSIAAIILLINLILTIREALCYFPSAAHPGRIRGASEPGPGENEKTKGTGWIEIAGMRYNVEWIIIGREMIEDGNK